MAEYLEVSHVYKQFPGVKALDNVSCGVSKGEVLGLIGINGAGKSTLMNVLAGEIKADSGEIRIEGNLVRITNQRESKANRIALIHQEPTVFGTMTVAENIFINDIDRYTQKGVLDYRRMFHRAQELLDLLDSDLDPHITVDKVAAGGRQMMEIARALAVDAQILLFDEPTSSLSIKEKEKLFDIIRRLKSQGKVIIYITHFIDEVKDLCDRVVVMMDGRVTAVEKSANLTTDQMIRLMVNVNVDAVPKKGVAERSQNDVLLDVKGLSNAEYHLDNISFRVHRGEVLGLWGLLGSGRSEIMRMVLGLIKSATGKVYYLKDGALVEMRGMRLLRESAYVTENRHLDGLFKTMSVWKNITIPNLKRYSHILMDTKSEKADAQSMIEKLSIKTPGENVLVSKLSGGNQQKVLMARWILKQPALFFLDEPTRGVDIGAKLAIHELILHLAEEGSAVVMISSEIAENLDLCDRVMIVRNGQIVGEVGRKDMNAQTLMRLSSGTEGDEHHD